jgi:hypothetical protein
MHSLSQTLLRQKYAHFKIDESVQDPLAKALLAWLYIWPKSRGSGRGHFSGGVLKDAHDNEKQHGQDTVVEATSAEASLRKPSNNG